MIQEVSLKELPNWCNRIKTQIQFGDVIGVNGDMGFGKTTIISSLIKTFNVGLSVTSPTFGIMEVHDLKNNKFILHIDAYRIKDESEVYGLGLDQFPEKNTIIFTEWFQNIPEYILKPNKIIDIKKSDQPDVRLIHYFSAD